MPQERYQAIITKNIATARIPTSLDNRPSTPTMVARARKMRGYLIIAAIIRARVTQSSFSRYIKKLITAGADAIHHLLNPLTEQVTH